MMKTIEEQQPLEVRIPMPWGYVAGCWYGDRSKRPLLALHGWQDNAGTFVRLAPLITPHRSLLAIEMPGNGRSTHLPAGIHYHTLDYVSVIHRIVAHYKWTRVSLMGHSMGAALSFYYAALFPHTVDMVIAIDVVHPICFEPRLQIEVLNYAFEKLVIENERIVSSEQCAEVPQNPPLFEFAQLEQQLYEGSSHSVDLAQCKHLLERNITRSEKHPHRYFFSCDRRTKYHLEQSMEPALIIELAKRIHKVNYLIIKAEHSYFLSEDTDEVIEILRANNPNLKRYDLPNTKHHLHLTQPELVAEYVLPFLLKYPPEHAHESQLVEVRSRL